MRYVNTETRSEVFPDDVDNLPANVKGLEEYHWFFTGYDEKTYTAKWDTMEIIKRPVPLKWVTCSPKEFIELFTIDELRGIYTHANTVIDCRIWLDRITVAPCISLNDEWLIAGMLYLANQGLITFTRYKEIMNEPATNE